jgi:malonyl-CoA O-methyltransferase
MSLDKHHIRQSFDRACQSYDSAADLQTQVGAELLERAAFFGQTPRRILDLGAGTGTHSVQLQRQFPDATIIALDFSWGMLQYAAPRLTTTSESINPVCADAIRLPLADNSIDLVFSNLMLQWCEEPLSVFKEVRRVLSPQGLTLFSTFGPDTLQELRAAWAHVDQKPHVNHFIDMHHIGDAAMAAGLSEPVLDVERLQRNYPSVLELMRELKALGAHNVATERPRGLTSRARLTQLTAAYEACRQTELLPATYEVIFGAAWGKKETSMSDEAVFPVAAIGRRSRE